MTTSESKGRFFLQNESIRITNRIDSNRELDALVKMALIGTAFPLLLWGITHGNCSRQSTRQHPVTGHATEGDWDRGSRGLDHNHLESCTVAQLTGAHEGRRSFPGAQQARGCKTAPSKYSMTNEHKKVFDGGAKIRLWQQIYAILVANLFRH